MVLSLLLGRLAYEVCWAGRNGGIRLRDLLPFLWPYRIRGGGGFQPMVSVKGVATIGSSSAPLGISGLAWAHLPSVTLCGKTRPRRPP